MIVPELVGPSMPFAVGLPAPDAAFTHIFDDTSLRIVLSTLDTISDFVRYLRAKEQLISSGRLISAAGEEELLACYLSNVDSSGRHAFVFPDGHITVDEGFWEEFSQSPERAAQLEADKISYVWDDLIERFSHHLLAGTQYFAIHPEVHEQEKGLKLLAQETRLARRMLGATLIDMLHSSPPDQRATRVMAPPASDVVTPTHYVVLLLPRPAAERMGLYREVRRQLLEQYCFLLKLDRPSAKDVIGIAMEPLNSDGNSEDLAYYDARQWTAADAERARNLKSEFIDLGLLSERTVSTASTSEYPVEGLPVLTRETWSAPTMRGRQRNHPCPCGSGLKYKRCCGRSH